MKFDRDITKLLIETSPTVEEADKVIEDIFELDTIKEKIAFLKGMFDVENIAREEKDESTYYAMLNAIINS